MKRVVLVIVSILVSFTIMVNGTNGKIHAERAVIQDTVLLDYLQNRLLPSFDNLDSKLITLYISKSDEELKIHIEFHGPIRSNAEGTIYYSVIKNKIIFIEEIGSTDLLERTGIFDIMSVSVLDDEFSYIDLILKNGALELKEVFRYSNILQGIPEYMLEPEKELYTPDNRALGEPKIW